MTIFPDVGCDHDVLMPLGQLGNLYWFRCRHCGIEFHKHKEDLGHYGEPSYELDEEEDE